MDLLDERFVQRIIADIESSQNRQRRRAELKSFEVYAGDLVTHVQLRLKELYPKTHNSFSIADLNLSKKINDKLSKAYKSSPYRELSTDNETNIYQDFLKDADSKKAWQTYDLYYNLHRSACMWFNYVPSGEDETRVVLRPLAPFQYSRVVDKLGDTKVFIVNFPSDDLFDTTDSDGINASIQDSMQDTYEKRYALWSDSQHVVVRCVVEKDGVRISYEPIEGNEEFINPLGVIPAVFSQQGDNAALPIINPITNQTIEYNSQYSSLLTGSNLQTFGHLILSHPEDQKMPDEIYNSLFTYSRLPQVQDAPETKLDYLNPNPNLDSQLKVIENYALQIIAEHLGDGAQTVGGNEKFTSGLDRIIAMSDINNKIEANQEIYSKAEQDLYDIAVAFFESMNVFILKPQELVVKYNKSRPVQSEEEILANIQKKVDLGLIERYEALMLLDPNLTVEKAKEKIEAVKQERMDNINSFMGSSNANNTEENQL